MAVIDASIGPIAGLIDTIIPDPPARAAAKLELLRLEGTPDLDRIKAELAAALADSVSDDPWISRARPAFLYVTYALLL